MNKRERVILTKIYAGLNQMTGLNPLNPMDVRVVSANLRTCTKAARDLLAAVENLGCGDYEEAETCADDALAVLAPKE